MHDGRPLHGEQAAQHLEAGALDAEEPYSLRMSDTQAHGEPMAGLPRGRVGSLWLYGQPDGGSQVLIAAPGDEAMLRRVAPSCCLRRSWWTTGAPSATPCAQAWAWASCRLRVLIELIEQELEATLTPGREG